MAKSTSRAGKPAAKVTAKTTKTPAAAGDTKSGLGFEGGVAILTTLLLIAAILMVDHELGPLGKGIFFKG